MDKLIKLKFYIDSLCVYNVGKDRVMLKLRELLENAETDSIYKCCSGFFNLLSANGSLKQHISSLILTDENIFTKAAAAGTADKLSPSVISGVKSDLKKLEEISCVSLSDFISDKNREILETLPNWEIGAAVFPLSEKWEEQTDALIDFHKINGYGNYAKYCAFSWRNGGLAPITSLNTIRLCDLKNYERQRAQVIDNTVAFLQGLPANNILLYGDRGTGKSSTVHAILNEYKSIGLRMIEISKGDINDLTEIRETISESPMKFIIFIDDLSFDSRDDSFGELKAALEGSLSGKKENAVIYATSNRRHLIKENFTDRENDVHRSDTMQEELSLSDRFGLSVNFMNPDKKDFLDIVEKIARDREVEFDLSRLLFGAEQWARRKGGRSPRCAKQYIDYVEACIKQGKEW